MCVCAHFITFPEGVHYGYSLPAVLWGQRPAVNGRILAFYDRGGCQGAGDSAWMAHAYRVTFACGDVTPAAVKHVRHYQGVGFSLHHE